MRPPQHSHPSPCPAPTCQLAMPLSLSPTCWLSHCGALAFPQSPVFSWYRSTPACRARHLACMLYLGTWASRAEASEGWKASLKNFSASSVMPSMLLLNVWERFERRLTSSGSLPRLPHSAGAVPSALPRLCLAPGGTMLFSRNSFRMVSYLFLSWATNSSRAALSVGERPASLGSASRSPPSFTRFSSILPDPPSAVASWASLAYTAGGREGGRREGGRR